MKQGFNPMGRRAVARVALAGLLGLTLVGCGSDDSNDDDSTRDEHGIYGLRDSYEAVQSGMSQEQVIDIVGAQPHARYRTSDGGYHYLVLEWSDYSGGVSENLQVRFTPTGLTNRAVYTLQGKQVDRLEKML